MSQDRHRPLKLRKLKLHLWVGLAAGFLMCAFPAAVILGRDYVRLGGRWYSQRPATFIWKSTEPRHFYTLLGLTQIPGACMMIFSVRSYFRRKKNDL
jgi:hypothetical protein